MKMSILKFILLYHQISTSSYFIPLPLFSKVHHPFHPPSSSDFQTCYPAYLGVHMLGVHIFFLLFWTDSPFSYRNLTMPWVYWIHFSLLKVFYATIFHLFSTSLIFSFSTRSFSTRLKHAMASHIKIEENKNSKQMP